MRIRWTRRKTVLAATLAILLTAGGLAVREWSFVRGLPPAVAHRMPWHCTIPRGLESEVRAGIEGLYSTDSRERLQAAHDLGCLGPGAAPAVPYLVAILADEVPDQWNPRRLPLNLGPPPSPFWKSWEKVPILGDLVRFLSWKTPEPGNRLYVCGRACRALAEVGPAAVDPLIAALRDDDPLVRMHAAIALGNIADPRAIDPLAALLKDNRQYDAQVAAAALAQFRSEPAAQRLAAALLREHSADEADGLLWPAFALARMGPVGLPPLIEGAKAGSPCRYVSVDGLGLYIQLHKNEKGEDMRQVAVALAGALSDPATAQRAAGYLQFNQVREPFIVEALLGTLHHPNSEDRRYALIALANLGGPEAAEAHVNLYHDPDLGWTATYGLARMGDRRALPNLRKALADPGKREPNRAAVLQALGYTQDPEALSILLDEMANVTDEGTFVAAAEVFKSRREPRAVPVLERGLARWPWSDTIREALIFCGGTPKQAPPKPDPALQAAAVAELTKGLSDPNLSKQGDAASGLLLLGTPEALAAVRPTYAVRDARFIDRFCAAFRFSEPWRLTDALLEVLAGHKDPTVRRGAARCLAGNKDPRVIPALRAATTDVCASVRHAAWCSLETLTGEQRPASVPTVWLNAANVPLPDPSSYGGREFIYRDPDSGEEW